MLDGLWLVRHKLSGRYKFVTTGSRYDQKQWDLVCLVDADLLALEFAQKL